MISRYRIRRPVRALSAARPLSEKAKPEVVPAGAAAPTDRVRNKLAVASVARVFLKKGEAYALFPAITDPAHGILSCISKYWYHRRR
jgi:hypothetical protein